MERVFQTYLTLALYSALGMVNCAAYIIKKTDIKTIFLGTIKCLKIWFLKIYLVSF